MNCISLHLTIELRFKGSFLYRDRDRLDNTLRKKCDCLRRFFNGMHCELQISKYHHTSPISLNTKDKSVAINMNHVVFLIPKQLSKTKAGKLRRKCQRRWQVITCKSFGGCNYLPLPLILAFGTPLLDSSHTFPLCYAVIRPCTKFKAAFELIHL